ncbi:ABC transporter ATP-binding protein [Oceanicaulis sp. MMSF_3324]|uniref:ABC transporter ATP-binding protein n=1 Tax=Oceanicaulis sp. MMSF_3324 TaxID=3046702 RepID=UPI00273DCFE9|nr:ABC transporter ATP-binding protein [Oceanicaulis sp. MMSF_3324]
MTQRSVIRLLADRVSIRRDGRDILSDVSLEVHSGEMIALVGPNGAGKSTLIRTLLGLLEPDAGGVMLDGGPVSVLSARARARQMAYLPQDRTVAWSVTGADLAALGRFAWGGAAYDRLGATDRDKVDQALELTGATALKNRLLHTLSGGEQARLHLARALASDASLLMADEPIAALDPRHQLEAMQVLRAQADRGASVVCALHDLELAGRYADRVAVLDRGRLIACGSPDAVLDAETLAQVFGVMRQPSGGFALADPGQA